MSRETKLKSVSRYWTQYSLGLYVPLSLYSVLCVKKVLEDVGDGLLLEDAAVGVAGQEPEPRDHAGAVTEQAPALVGVIDADQRKARDEAVEIACLVAEHVEPDVDVFAEDLFRVDGLAFGEEVQFVLEEAGQEPRFRAWP